ncbi:RsmB/NOP family class I SAM-dependent RNA methyltransferase [Roseovarius sp. LXJ103]|uniref:RsmB/NOP family class I SAM-dependent RNA methyltransferase n=1 Tax=Roseovarius carneus TaxID=2853164 RepID=UPI000D61F67B|nr:RsmB/NOP family class I SAM-dependent RNA methyltransferase [Roseovarius carneus]MBZ8119485.1 RsmB/NOP family class I SAM-dependent RNA methyltransferase [Roseovarius carneus]PWE34885.1 SAM-dependent methyltransferase [Pelagicola sp. LXJ1103]
MTPGARVAAAAEILDRITEGTPAEKALTGWARGARYAGSKDRAAVRDHVFDVLRCWRSYAALGGGETGRARMIGALREAGADLSEIYTGIGHAPEALSLQESTTGEPPVGFAAWDLPDWIGELVQEDLGAEAESYAMALRARAPVMLRVNTARCTPEEAMAALAKDTISMAPHPIAKSSLKVIEGARKVALSDAFGNGLVELQDGSSQAAMETVPLTPGTRVLDYCAGGGGKALALAARGASVVAWDIAAERMRDLPARAARAGVQIPVLEVPEQGAPYDIVLCDAPCSGSGTWRRAPEAKWRLTPERLETLMALQDEVLRNAAPLVALGGRLVYATCSVFECENMQRIEAFISATPGWQLETQEIWPVSDGGDGFFVAHLLRE